MFLKTEHSVTQRGGDVKKVNKKAQPWAKRGTLSTSEVVVVTVDPLMAIRCVFHPPASLTS